MQRADANVSAPSTSLKRDAAKAHAVRNQCKLWESALAVRIALQRGLSVADRLPGSAAHQLVLSTVAEAEAAFDGASVACTDAISELLDIMEVLLERQSVAAGIEVEGVVVGRKRGRSDGSSLNTLWADIEAAQKQFEPLRDASVDRWYRKTLLATGRAAMRSQMHTLNQSLSQQVTALMRNPARAVERSERDAHSMASVLCEARKEADRPMGGVAGTYDDTAFYQVLLQEFLESSDIDGSIAAVMRVRLCSAHMHRACCRGRNGTHGSESHELGFWLYQSCLTCVATHRRQHCVADC
jgi:protein AATF/BFR2